MKVVYFPTGHREQEPAPLLSLYIPAGQGRQKLPVWLNPEGQTQSWAEVLPAGAIITPGHRTQFLVTQS
eukprot:607155-Hanusia_phi.AAC.12